MQNNVSHKGSCHCGAVKITVQAPANLDVLDCNCSICARSGFLHLIVAKSEFELLSGQHQLSEYRFGSGVAVHTFCKICGIKVFYTPRSHPDGVDVNVRCLDQSTIQSLKISPFDGKNWEQNIASLEPLPNQIK